MSWVERGLAALTGWPEGPGWAPPEGLVERIEGWGYSAGVDAMELLAERAAVRPRRRQGRISLGGACRLLRGADGWLAVSLPRSDDHELVAAWLELDESPRGDPWSLIEALVADRECGVLVERGALVGLAVGAMGEQPEGAAPVVRWPVSSRQPVRGRPVVVDLSSLWAGPVCARILGRAGGRVIKVESLARPDGARFGSSAFFDRLHVGHESVALDLDSEQGRLLARELIWRADVVIEASRPRALAAWGLDPAELVADPGGPSVWVSITGHGRDDGMRIGFGDDAAVAGGLVARTPHGPCFAADAIADPLSGVVAAAAALAALDGDEAVLIEVALARVAAHVAAGGPGAWQPVVDTPPPATPGPPRGRAPVLGADTERVLSELGMGRCW